jgi:hypothetical protein
MKTKIGFTLFLMASLLLAAALTVHLKPTEAQATVPDLILSPQQEADPSLWSRGLVQTQDGLWVVPEHSPQLGQAVYQTSGGPDDFGYTWNDNVPFNWINAGGGIDTGISNSVVSSSAINIGFPFKFYENTYSQLYVSRNGFLTFHNWQLSRGQSFIPDASLPNDIIAPYWTPLAHVNGYVRYLHGGTTPNRWFVVEWNRVQQTWGHEYTFQAILHENGDIVFQYGTMNYVGGSRTCEDVGIEDIDGLDGFSLYGFCNTVSSNHAARIYRPAPAARVKVTPLHQGSFSHAAATETFAVPIRNTGELGSDTYDLLVSSTWPVSLYAADGVTPLTDSNGNSIVDTGPVAQGETVTIIAKVDTPIGTSLGDHNTVSLTVRSSLDTSKSREATLRTAVPARFAQIYRDATDQAMSLYLVQPEAQAYKKASPDDHFGSNMAVAETAEGNFVYLWSKSRSVSGLFVNELEYRIVDATGTPIRPITRLTNHSNASVYTNDLAPAVATAPDGRIGILWYRYLWNSTTQQHNYNIHFAILEANGNLVHGPVNVTNNNTWGSWGDLNVPRFLDPRLAATDNNRFVLSWRQNHIEPPSGNCAGNCSLDDIYLSVRSSSGAIIRSNAKFTQDTPGWDDAYYSPVLTHLNDNRTLLAFQRSGNLHGIYYAVVDDSGNTIHVMTKLPGDASGNFSPAATQLSNGNIVIAWTGRSTWQDPTVIYYAVLSPAYSLLAGPSQLSNPAAVTGDSSVSITADTDGRAILTWTDQNWNYRRNLYYALIGSNGIQLTPPLVFHTSKAPFPSVDTSYHTYGNTSYSWLPPEVDGVIESGTPLAAGQPGGTAPVSIRYTSHGTSGASGVTITATLPSELTYIGDSSGTTPLLDGNSVTWQLPDIAFLEERQFFLYVSIPSDAEYGTRYPVTLTLSIAGEDENPANNTMVIEVMVAHQIFLPAISDG